MKLLLLIDNLGSGGAQRQMATLSILLKNEGYDISLLLYGFEDYFIKEIQNKEIPIHYIITKNYLGRILKVREFIRKGNYNTVISFMDVPNFLNNFAAIGGKRWKVITSERSSKENYLTSIQGKIFGWFQRYSDYIICNSHNAKVMWGKYYPIYENKLAVIYNPVILPEITSEYIPKRGGKLHIVIAASFQYLKNPIGLIRALALMSVTELKNIEINWYGSAEVTFGDTRAYDEASDLIKLHSLENIIYFNEPTKAITHKMNEADVVALFSELEGLPNAICEGMMIGKPIIMSKVSDYELLVDESNGFLCDWDNQESIKDALIQASNLSIEDLKFMGLNSKKKALQLFSKKIITKQWLSLIEINTKK